MQFWLIEVSECYVKKDPKESGGNFNTCIVHSNRERGIAVCMYCAVLGFLEESEGCRFLQNTIRGALFIATENESLQCACIVLLSDSLRNRRAVGYHAMPMHNIYITQRFKYSLTDSDISIVFIMLMHSRKINNLYFKVLKSVICTVFYKTKINNCYIFRLRD